MIEEGWEGMDGVEEVTRCVKRERKGT